jgi:hypothetical protein
MNPTVIYSYGINQSFTRALPFSTNLCRQWWHSGQGDKPRQRNDDLAAVTFHKVIDVPTFEALTEFRASVL